MTPPTTSTPGLRVAVAAIGDARRQVMARAGLASTLPRDERGSALAEALETGALAGRGAVIDVLPRLITTGLTTGTTATLVPSLLRLYRWLL